MVAAVIEAAADRATCVRVKDGDFELEASLLPRGIVAPELDIGSESPDPLQAASDGWRRRSGDG